MWGVVRDAQFVHGVEGDCKSCCSATLLIKIYRTIFLSIVLYGFETWSLTLREERRLRVIENRVLRRLFGTTRDEVTGEWRKLRNEKLRYLYSLTERCAGGKIERNEMGSSCGAYGGGERCALGSRGET